jgi:hypothetical protein
MASIEAQLEEAERMFAALRPTIEPNLTHEVAYLQKWCSSQAPALDPALSSFDRPPSVFASVFTNSTGHDCLSSGCKVVALPPSIPRFVCPLEHPASEPRHPDGTIVHASTHAVYICPTTGKVHLCMANRCEYSRQMAGEGVGEYTCMLTARMLGSDLVGTVEYKDGRQFGDGEVMTWQERVDRSNTLQRGVVATYEFNRPDNVESRSNALADCEQHGGRRRELLTLAERAVAEPTARLEGPQARLAIMPARKRAAPAALPVRPPPRLATVSETVMAQFSADVELMIKTLRERISTQSAMATVTRQTAQVAERIKIAAKHCNGRVAQGRAPAGITTTMMNPVYARGIFDTLMGPHLDYYQWVCEVTGNEEWKSGRLFDDRRLRLAERMRRLWSVYSGGRTVPAKRYTHIGLPMLAVLCKGYTISVNAIAHREISAETGAEVTTNITLRTHRPGNIEIRLVVIEPDPMLQDVCQLDVFADHYTGSDSPMKMVTMLHSCYDAIFSAGVPASFVSQLIVPHLCLETDAAK